jgi:neutral ceramidase
MVLIRRSTSWLAHEVCRRLWFLLLIWQVAAFNVAQGQTSMPYLIGQGMADITGPAVGMPMWGFGRPDQIGEGIHTRLRSRAFATAQANDPRQRLVFVSAELGSIDHHIVLEVVERLQSRFGETYTLDNVIISATHTHAGPSGYWHSRTDTGLDGGFYPAHFEAIVAGITDSIVTAHENLQPGNILINAGNVTDAGVNRSAIAYRQNPQYERDQYSENTNTTMTLLKFMGASGGLGAINWYALHPTAMNYYNRLISGDHKGYASSRMEERQRAHRGSSDNFIAAFAQSDPGDVTPNTNLNNTGPGETDVETTQIMGQRQLAAAQTLFDEAQEPLAGAIDSRRIYVDLSRYEVVGEFTGAGTRHTCASAYGYAFAGGSTEDGGGHFLFKEGMTEQSMWRDWLVRLIIGAPKWTEPVAACQAPKAILLETGTGTPPLQSQIRSITVARIGQLVLIALPAEVTTMAGRRLRRSVMDELGDWAKYVVVAGYSNGYAGYITTPEEYRLQQYEGGHTLHGPWSLPAYQQIVSRLARALESGAPVASPTAYDDWRGHSSELALPFGAAKTPPNGARLGEAETQVEARYRAGQTAAARFWSTNPTVSFPKGKNYLLVERNTAAGWRQVADDSHWSTRVRWQLESGAYVAELSWAIPHGAMVGKYRVSHFGFDASGAEFAGMSSVFEIVSGDGPE